MVTVWNTWTNTTYTNSTTVTGYNTIWNDWITQGTASTSATLNTVWCTWMAEPTGSLQSRYQTPPQPSEEEREAREQERLARQARYAEIDARHRAEAAEARQRAEELLKVILTDEQWAAYTEKKEFSVIGKSGRRYLIRHGLHGNVKVVEDEVVVESLCIQPPTSEVDDEGRYREVPVADALVAQVLGIRHDEENFRRVANITVVNRARVQRAQEALV